MLKKNKIISLLILLLCSFSLLFSQKKGVIKNKSFLWQLNFELNQSYILGSIHFLKKEMYPLKDEIEKAFDRSDVLVVEADISANKMAQHLKMTMEKSMYSGDDTLENNLSQKTFGLTEEILKSYGIDIQFYQKIKPWFLALTITGIELMKLGFDPNYGVDKYFLDKVSDGVSSPGMVEKEILELEGIEYQINLFDQFTREESENFLFYSLQEVSKYANEIDDVVMAWLKGDALTMERILKTSVNDFVELTLLNIKFIDDRNQKMTEKIFAYLKTNKTYFIVVGAAHLIGNSGIIQLLRDKGVKVKQR